MEIKNKSNLIEKYRNLTFEEQPEINLVSPCKINEGVIRHSEFEKNRYILRFEKEKNKICFFIPASGSGSRMFRFLYEFLVAPDEETRSKTEQFLNSITSFAFFELLPYSLKEQVRNYDIKLEDFVSYLLQPEGLGLGELPKGLIPFHRSRSFILNAFQEQLLQGLMIKDEPIYFHFTINKTYKETIQTSLRSIQHLTGRVCDVEYSEQNSETNSIAFDDDKNPIRDSKGKILTRPSGHGALLGNLNAIKDKDIIFIKNIDNVQHESQAADSIANLKYLGGILQAFKEELQIVHKSDNIRHQWSKLNEKYQFLPASFSIEDKSETFLQELMHRPIRVCGMIRNEGQPGGGPFWVRENGLVTKQIVEKSQIHHKEQQYRIMAQSQYFNPVLMALSNKDFQGNPLDLRNFADKEKYFKVEKTFQNQEIHFIEHPGLWNGSMANWWSIFVEIPSSTFTPVKTVLDLLQRAHQE